MASHDPVDACDPARALRSAVSSDDETLDEVAYAHADAPRRAPVLFVVLEADRPMSRGARYSLVGVDTITIGRGATRDASRSGDGRKLDVRVPGKWISSRHAVLRAAAGEWILEDSGSRNGTFLNGQRIERAVVREGDVLEAGRVFFMVRGAPADEGPIQLDEDASAPVASFGLRTLLPELQESYASLTRVAQKSDVPILFLGPTGSGKELLAREVHTQSNRAGAFVAVNCGALPPTLVESLLFGHVKGAFSGAARDELGFLRSANHGTLFLDEIGDLPPSSQAALLRVLQEQEVIPIGATRATPVDVRIVSATHRPLEALAASGNFRSDLLARLKGYTHRLLPLHERMPDFGLLLADVLERVAKTHASRLVLMPDAARALLAYAWPHNIRELYQAMAATVALGTTNVLELRHLPSELLAPRPAGVDDDAALSEELILRDRLVVLLHEHRGNVTAVARAMGKAPTQIHRWTHRFQIDVEMYRKS
jgi:DNA-binding NtrC family response regulator